VLAGHSKRAAHILSGLKAEGIADAVVLWALSREARMLFAIKSEVAKGVSIEVAYKAQQIWDKRKPLVASALQRLSIKQLRQTIIQCAQADQMIKGLRQGDAWEMLLAIAIGLSMAARRV
jgi:DNA polymerase III subunit delta